MRCLDSRERRQGTKTSTGHYLAADIEGTDTHTSTHTCSSCLKVLMMLDSIRTNKGRSKADGQLPG
eukprot:1162101-Pelagomonas_calceolata.AAC.19